MTLLTRALQPIAGRSRPPQAAAAMTAAGQAELADILIEQLRYLIAFADQEQARLERVKRVLMEAFI